MTIKSLFRFSHACRDKDFVLSRVGNHLQKIIAFFLEQQKQSQTWGKNGNR